MKNNSVIKQLIIMATAALFLAFCFDLSVETIRSASYFYLIACIAVLVITFRKNIPSPSVFITMLTGMLLKLSYVIYTPVWCRQHDVVDFGAGEGHAAYIEYILSHKSLPDFDPRSVWAFFQPPLHHFISAAWMWLNIRSGLILSRAQKNVQILPLIYMCLLAYITYMMCRELNMRSGGTLITMLIVSFHPIFIMMSGSINNDALSVMLSVLALYVALVWYMYPTTGKIALLAVCIGLAMSAKLSAGLVAPPIAVLMIYKIVNDTERFRDKPKRISYILELAAFAVIVIPLGLWWPIRNKILFDMPPGYIPEVGEHVEKAGLIPTIFDVRTASPFLYMKSNGYSHDEYNLILATLKSSLFGEGSYENVSPLLTGTGWVLLFALVLIIILQIVAMITTCASSEAGPAKGIKMYLCTTVVTFVAGYVVFALCGMNLSAMDFRYSAGAVSIMSVFLGLRYDRLGALSKKAGRAVMLISSLAFAAVSAIFYILIGLYHMD